MRRYPSLLILLACLVFFPASSATAWSLPSFLGDLFGGDDTLLVIDDERYTDEDFKRWWRFWNDEDLDLPPTPEPYINWLLLAREGERMELHADPSFQRQTGVFLKARTLLMLKNEEINSRIEVSEEEIRERYEQERLPRWQVRRLHFDDEEAATAAWEELQSEAVSMDELLERAAEAGGPINHHEHWVRPSGIDPGWEAIFRQLEVGEVVRPEEHEGGPMLYQMLTIKGGDEEYFARQRQSLQRELWKEQENALTLDLINRLREKYEVEINEERLAALDLDAPADTLTDTVIIATNRQNLTERDFMTLARRDMALRPEAAHAAFDEEQAEELKDRVVSGFIAQSLTNWASVDRGYEKEEPFKWEYQFHLRHRLKTTLERRLFVDTVEIGEEDIRRHYQDNLDRYTRPAMVKLHMVDDTQGPVERIWREVLTGTTFARATREHLERSLPSQDLPLDHLDPEVRAIVESLSPGDTSQPFTSQDTQAIIHLVDRTPAQPLELEQVKDSIRSQLRQQEIERQRREYLEQLKSRSHIEVRERQWRNLKTELGATR